MWGGVCADCWDSLTLCCIAAVTNQIVSSLSFILPVCSLVKNLTNFPETQVEMSYKKQIHHTQPAVGAGGSSWLLLHLQTLCSLSPLAKHIHIGWVCIRNSSLLLQCVWKAGSWGFPLMADLPT